MAESKSTYGLLARFTTTPAVYEAAKVVRDAGYSRWDVYTPFPVHGMDAAMGLSRSRVPTVTLLGGVLGFLGGLLMVWWMNAYDYPLIVGGKPYFSPIFPFPIFYEMTILCAGIGTFLGMFIFNMLPRHHHPIFESEEFARASDDHFFICIETADPKFELEKTRALLESTGADHITTVES